MISKSGLSYQWMRFTIEAPWSPFCSIFCLFGLIFSFSYILFLQSIFWWISLSLWISTSSIFLLHTQCFLHSISDWFTMGSALGKDDDSKPYVPESKLEAKMIEAMRRRASEGSAMKSFNSLILKFPKIDENLRKCKTIFEQFGGSSIPHLYLIFLLLEIYLSAPIGICLQKWSYMKNP